MTNEILIRIKGEKSVYFYEKGTEVKLSSKRIKQDAEEQV